MIRKWGTLFPWTEVLKGLGDDTAAWLIVEEGSWSYETVSDLSFLREGGIRRSSVRELKECALRVKQKTWKGWLVALEGKKALGYAEFLRKRYGPQHTIEKKSVFWSRFLELESELAGNGYPKMHEKLAFTWLETYHTFLDSTKIPFHMLFDLMPGDERLMEFAGLSIKDLAYGLGVTRSHLARRLKTQWKREPGEVLRELRMIKSRQLLAETGHPVSEIARSAGYRSISGFYEAFERYFKETPNEVRKQVGDLEPARLGMDSFPTKDKRNLSIPFSQEIDLKKNDMVKSPDWDGPYFQILTCGKSDVQFVREFDISLSTLIRRITVVVTLEGKARFESALHGIETRQGMAISYPVPMNARWIVEPGERWKRIWIQLHGDLAEDYFRSLWTSSGNVHELALGGDAVQKLKRLAESVEKGRSASPMEWSRDVYFWLLDYVSEVRDQESSNFAPIHLSDTQFSSSTRTPKNLSEYAAQTGYSLSHLQAKMSIQWNESPGRVLRAARLDLAAEQLRTTDESVRKIAKQAGYATSSAFIRAFSSRFKTTPLNYRRVRRTML